MITEKSNKIVINDNITFYVELDHTKKEWNRTYGKYDLWDFPIEDFVNGAVEPDENMVYWLIDGRLFETE